MNEGTLAPITIRADAGSILNCTHPAPTFGRTSVGNFLVELVYSALAPAVPERVLAGAGSTPMWGQYLFGKQQDGRRFAPLNCINGGLGARPDRDGVSCLTFPVNVGNAPAEVIESDVPVLVRKRALWRDSAGPGRFRGGFGQEFEVEVLGGDLGPDGDIVTSFRAGRFKHPVAGILGGGDAPRGELTVNGEAQASGLQRNLVPGDVFLCRAPGGAGLGDPRERDPAAVARDLEEDLISEDYARRHHGWCGGS
jgi:N-methylhydantoinase B